MIFKKDVEACKKESSAEEETVCLVVAAEFFLKGHAACDPSSESEPDEPDVPVVTTTCGDIPIDDQLSPFNQIQLDAHNAYRQKHNTNPLAYDHDLATKA
jgi:uncharacterized protein YkwD